MTNQTGEKFPNVDIHYDCDNFEVYAENMFIALQKFDELVAYGYPSVQVISSTHPYSEGIWVEAGMKPRPKSHLDQVIKSNDYASKLKPTQP